MKWNIEEIKKDVKENLSDKRYQHSLNVMEEAEALAKKYKVNKANVDKCILCGLTHDMAKELSKETNEKIIKKYNLKETLLDEKNKNLIHGFIASIIVREKYKFDEDMILAIRYHTTGYPNMDLLGKIIYLADKIEKSRDSEMAKEARVLAYKDIDKAIIYVITRGIDKLKKEQKEIADLSYDTLEYLKETNK